ncbi:hypothetical protein D3H55_21235 [Bacillus salacetis]|uniref:ABC-2 transporter permease n=1 Tax=Bacillus salacetis TaxID=2315464 RepID=A0A3A1QNT3_9BACI|nr:hypothetical protein [Bacillus salacetis]RIW28700.1 hypothetical protein D3H55_21235 [Bacillus salacetis]
MDSSRRNDKQFDVELDNLEKEIGFKLDEYDVEYPSEAEMMRTIEAVRPFVPVKENRWKGFSKNVQSLMKKSYQEVFYFSPLFWILNLLFLSICLSAVTIADQNPYAALMLFAPLPTITGLFEILKSRQSGMAELELSFKYSLQEIILSKMFIIGGFNIGINLIATAALSVFAEDAGMGKLLLYWMTPFTVITGISFLIASRLRHLHAVTAALVIWIGSGVMLSNTAVIEKLEAVPAAVYVLVILAAVVCTALQANRLYKRGVNYEFNH